MNKENVRDLLMDIPTRLCRNMNHRFVNTILKDINADISQHHFMILKILSENKSMYVTEFVDLLSITKSQMTSSLDKLISLQYVERKHDSEDRRKIYVTITKSGSALTEQIKKKIDEQIRVNLDKMSEKELTVLENGLMSLFNFCKLYEQ